MNNELYNTSVSIEIYEFAFMIEKYVKNLITNVSITIIITYTCMESSDNHFVLKVCKMKNSNPSSFVVSSC